MSIIEELERELGDDSGDGGPPPEPDNQDSEDAKPDEYRFGDDVPEPLRGKSPAEAAELIQELQNAGRLLVQQLQTRPQPAPAPTEPEPPEVPSFSLDDFAGDDQSQFQQKLDQYLQARSQPLVQQLGQIQAQTVWSQAFQSLPLFQKYPQEAQSLLSQYSGNFAALADPKTYYGVQAQLMQNHMDDLVREEAERRAKPTPPDTHRPGNRPEGDKGGKKTLTRAQRMVADALGVPHEEYIKYL